MSCSLHDLMTLDGRGVPGISIVTSAFKDAVDSQSRALGFDPAVLYVPHPIQNRTPDELVRIADGTIETAIRMLTIDR